MNRLESLRSIRRMLTGGRATIGSWMQIPDASVAEIMGRAGYDWVAVDLEHGSIDIHQLPDLFRALELGNTLPLVRLAEGSAKECKRVLDAGAAGVIAPMIDTAEQLRSLKDACCWPPRGTRGVGFSRANLFGKRFDEYAEEAREPMLVAMIEHARAVENLEEILQVDGLDAIMVGPYDLSASLGVTGMFDTPEFVAAMDRIKELSAQNDVPCGVHVVDADARALEQRIQEGYRFIAYSLDAVFLNKSTLRPPFSRQ